MVRPLEPELDRHVTGGKIDQTPGNEERRNPPRAFFLQHDRGLGDAFDAADARADEHAGRDPIVVFGRPPARVVERLPGGAHRIGDEIVDLALLLGLHPLIGIVGAVGAVAARNDAGDLGRQIGDVEALDPARAACAGKQPAPTRLHAATERRHHPYSRDDDTSHVRPFRAWQPGRKTVRPRRQANAPRGDLFHTGGPQGKPAMILGPPPQEKPGQAPPTLSTAAGHPDWFSSWRSFRETSRHRRR